MTVGYRPRHGAVHKKCGPTSAFFMHRAASGFDNRCFRFRNLAQLRLDPSPPAPLDMSQVGRGFDSEAAGPKKRSFAEAMGVSQRSQHERHLNWLTRHKGNTTFGSWRPRKIHRVASKQWCRSLDSQFRSCSGQDGLSFF